MKSLGNKIFLFVFGVCVLLAGVFVLVTVAFLSNDLSIKIKVFLVIISAFAVVSVTFWLSKRFAKKIAKPINEIDFSVINKEKLFVELTPFCDEVEKQSRKIRSQLNQISHENKAQSRIRKDFAANVSHDLKTPITSISGYAEIIKNGIARDEDIVRFSDKIYSEAQRLITLIDDIIKISKLDENAIETKKEQIDLYSICKDVIARLEKQAEKKNITFELIGAPVRINAISQIVDEMVYNLCENAIKYNRENGKVTVSVMQTTTETVLSVADTGIGIEESEFDRVFERFYRVNKSRSSEIKGTGLGLSIVKHGALVHGANVKLESEINKGTKITITFRET